MGSGLPGVFAGALALITLQTIVSSDAATGRVGGIFDSIASGTSRFLDARVPAFNTAKAKASSGSSSGGSSGGPTIVVPNPVVPGFGFTVPNPFGGRIQFASATAAVTPPIPSAGTV